MKTQIDIRSAIPRWTNGRFLLRSSYYTGRGVLACDLDSRMLEGIYAGIKKEVGQTEATNFAKFVNNLRDLSASAFIQAFERFWASNCAETNIKQGERDGDQITGYGTTAQIEGFMLIAEAFSGRRTSPEQNELLSREIKARFTEAHKAEIEY